MATSVQSNQSHFETVTMAQVSWRNGTWCAFGNCSVQNNLERTLCQAQSRLSADNLSILFFCVALPIVGGFYLNLVTLLMFLRQKLYRSLANLSVLNLAVSDLLNAVFIFPMLLWALLDWHWPGEQLGCVVYNFGFLYLGSVSLNNMAAISIER